MIAEHISMLLKDLGCDVAGPIATIDEAFAILNYAKLDGALLDANLNGVDTGPIAAALNEASVRSLLPLNMALATWATTH